MLLNISDFLLNNFSKKKIIVMWNIGQVKWNCRRGKKTQTSGQAWAVRGLLITPRSSF